MIICPNCNTEHPENKHFCSQCGTKFETDANTTQTTCPHCQSILETGKDFCGECGGKVHSDTTSKETTNSHRDSPASSDVIEEFKLYKLGAKGNLGLGGPFGMKNYCTIVTVKHTSLHLLVCRKFDRRGLPVKPKVKEMQYSEIHSVNLKKMLSCDWIFYTSMFLIAAAANPLFLLFAFLAFTNIFGRKVTINLKYEDPVIMRTEGKKADEFVALVVNQLKNQ